MEIKRSRFLVSDEGRAFALEVEGWEGDETRRLRRLRKVLEADLAGAIIGQFRARRSLAGRHSLASGLHLTTDAVRQTSSEATARWRARRFADRGLVADMTCSVGIDALALAESTAVVAMDRALDRLVLARANLAGAPFPTLCVAATALESMPRVEAVFADPDRRTPDGRRVVDPEKASPPLGAMLEAAKKSGVGGVAVKLSPMADLAPLGKLGEIELISVGRELKEVVLWSGDLAGQGTRVSRPDRDFSWTAEPRVAPPAAPPGEWILDPDPGLVRSGLLGALAVELGLAPLEPSIAYLSGPSSVDHPLLTPRRVLAVLRARPAEISRFLVERGIGRVTAARRGHPTSPEEILSRLRLAGGDGAAHLLLTRTTDSRVVIVTSSQPGPG